MRPRLATKRLMHATLTHTVQKRRDLTRTVWRAWRCHPQRDFEVVSLSVSAKTIYLCPMRMHRRGPAWIAALPLVAVACAGQVTSSLEVTPPPAAPSVASASPETRDTPPEDADGDGVKNDDCPDAAETKNGFEDDDGCPDEPPDFYVSDNVIRYTGSFAFGLLGGLQNSSQPTIDGIATLLGADATLELVEIAAHVADGSDPRKTSQQRADAVVQALVKAGVDGKRLRAKGFGNQCPDAGSSVLVRVLRRGGADTGATSCAP